MISVSATVYHYTVILPEVSLDTGTLQSPDITLAETTFNNTMTSEFPEMPAVVAMKSRIHTDDHLGMKIIGTLTAHVCMYITQNNLAIA